MKNIIHPLLRLWVKVASRFFFEKIEISGTENLPFDCPVLFASNHPNSFLDSLVMTICVGRSLHYTARGDFFKTKIASALLRYIQILPLFRREEGKELMHKNTETFSYCIDVWKKNGTVSIFPEGICENEWNLRPLRKGTARLANEAWNNPDIGDKLKVVPVAIHYSSWLKICPVVYIEFLKNIEKESFSGINEDGTFNKKFNEQLNAILSEKCIVVDKSDDVISQNKIVGFVLKNYSDGATSAKRLQDNFLAPGNEPFKTNYNALCDFLIKENINYGTKSGVGFFSFTFSALMFAVAYLLNALPYYLSKFIVRKITNDTVFYDSLLFCMLLVIYQVYIIVFLLTIGCTWAGISVLLLTVISALHYENAKRNIQCFLKKDKLRTVHEMLNGLFETGNG